MGVEDKIVGKIRPTPERLTHEDEVTGYLDELLAQVKAARERCDVIIPGDPAETKKQQQIAWQRCLMSVGVSMGSINALYSAGWLDEAGFNIAHDRTLDFFATRIVGVI